MIPTNTNSNKITMAITVPKVNHQHHNSPSSHDKAIGMVDTIQNQDMPHANIELFLNSKIWLSEIQKTDDNM